MIRSSMLFHIEKEMNERIDVLIPGREVHAFIGGMYIVIRQAAAHEAGFHAGGLLQHGDRADAAAFAAIEGTASPYRFKCLGQCPYAGGVQVGDRPGTL